MCINFLHIAGDFANKVNYCCFSAGGISHNG